jgi:hypothetical protein
MRNVRLLIFAAALIACGPASGQGNSNSSKEWKHLSEEDTLILETFPYNSTADDYAPVMMKNGKFYFTSCRENISSEDRVLFDNEDIYSCLRSIQGFTEPSLSGFFNNGDHTAMAGLAADQSKIFVYKTFGDGDLYSCEENKEKWTSPKRMKGPVNSQDHEQSVATNGTFIVWSSEREGGKGGHDLYWAKPDPYGLYSDYSPFEPANTAGDEVDVSFSPDGKTLFFSSDGTPGSNGSFDIFSVAVDPIYGLKTPELLGFPMNTPYSDRYFFDADSIFFLSSDRPGGNGGFDLYKGWVMSPKPSIRKLRLSMQQTQAQQDTLIVIEKDRYGVMNDILDSAGVTEYYARVQIGAFNNMSVETFRAAHPSLRSTPIIIEWVKTDRGRLGKFLIDVKYSTLKDASAIQEEMWNVHKIADAFIAVYNMSDERIAIYNSVKGEFVLLSQGAKPVKF